MSDDSYLLKQYQHILKKQIQDNYPPPTRAAYRRLQQLGIPRQETKRRLMRALDAMLYYMDSERTTFNQPLWKKMMETLPDEPWVHNDNWFYNESKSS